MENDDMEFEDLEEIIKPKKKRSKDAGFEFLIAQIAVVMAALLVAITLKLIGGNAFHKTRDKYISMFNDPTSVSEVIETIAQVFKLTEGGDVAPEESSSDTQSDIQNATPVVADPITDDDTILSGSPSSAESGSTPPVSESSSSAEGSALAAASETPASSDTGAKATSLDEDASPFVIEFDKVSSLNGGNKLKQNSLLMPAMGEITSKYGFRTDPFSGAYTMHAGLDIANSSGTPIVSALSGTVKSVGSSSSYGKYIIISHGNGFDTLYAHCSKIIAREGAAVARGEIIAEMGSTGKSTGPHCHFEVRINDVRINPEWVLPASAKV